MIKTWPFCQLPLHKGWSTELYLTGIILKVGMFALWAFIVYLETANSSSAQKEKKNEIFTNHYCVSLPWGLLKGGHFLTAVMFFPQGLAPGIHISFSDRSPNEPTSWVFYLAIVGKL